MKIKLYEDKYKDDMIFMVLQAKDALGRLPRINEDLLDIKKHYLDHGDGFWIAADDNDRVIGCGGYSRIEGTNEAFSIGCTSRRWKSARASARLC